MRIGIAGLGLIGGSLALALREKHEVVGFDTAAGASAAAASAGLRTVARLEELLPADAVLVATPLGHIVPTLERLAGRADGAVLMDAGSLKRSVADYAARAPERARIVGGHPMAGSTASGFDAADARLFQGRPFLLVPTARADVEAMAIAGTIARDAGGVVAVCSTEVHDRAMARLIAAPLAAAAAVAVAAGAEAEPLLGAAGPGFRDATRLAETSTDLALDLLFGGADTTAAIDEVIAVLRHVRDALAREERADVRGVLASARSVRKRLA